MARRNSDGNGHSLSGWSDPPGLIVTRTPLRISFAGGGTDLPDFYMREEGAVVSSAIDKYVYVLVRKHGQLFGENFRLNYSETENVSRLDDMKNDIARECVKLLKVKPPLYISTVADIPALTGLGSSSSFAVGLLHALHAYRGEYVSAGQLAREACYVEIDVLGHPIGKQDQYAAAFGGMNLFLFKPDGGVTLEPQRLLPQEISRLFSNVMMFYTGMNRDSASVLTEQKKNTPAQMKHLRIMRRHAEELRGLMQADFNPLELGRILDQTWRLKRQLASSISNRKIDLWYERALAAGALGGKILGAGGGGFLFLIVPPSRQRHVRKALHELAEQPVGYEAHGSLLLLPST